MWPERSAASAQAGTAGAGLTRGPDGPLSALHSNEQARCILCASAASGKQEGQQLSCKLCFGHSAAAYGAAPHCRLLTAAQVQGEAQRTFGPLLDRQAKADRIRLVSHLTAGMVGCLLEPAGHAAQLVAEIMLCRHED